MTTIVIMKTSLILAGLLSLAASLSAQKEIRSTTSALMHAGEYDQAEKYLDSIIASAPNTVDALMMKGNVILNKALREQSDLSLESEKDESIYDQTIGTLGQQTKTIDNATAAKVSALWQHCVQIDPKRIDIYQGLCTLYGMALMKDELIAELPALIKVQNDPSEAFIYSLEDYARAFEQRQDVDDCMEVYKKIQSLYPACGGLAGDMAVMYQMHGRIKESLEYARKAAAMKGNDFMTCYNVAALIAIGGDLDEGLRAFTTADDASPLFIYYRGIIQYYHDDPAWHESLKSFINKYKAKDADDGRLELAKLMTKKNFMADSAGYAAVAAIQPYELEYLLISLKAKELSTDKYAPMMRLGDMYAQKQCYDKAFAAFKAVEKVSKTPEQDSTYHFHLAYAQYKAGAKTESLANWKLFLSSGNIFRQSAACYFTGTIYKEQGKKKEAKELFEKVASQASESKYANFCKWELE